MKPLFSALLFYILFLSTLVISACSEKLVVNEEAVIVLPVIETTPVASSDDAADDPAIWISPTNPGASLILGTDKQSGLAVYSLDGEIVQFLERGRLNNIDLRQGLVIGGESLSLAVATNRTDHSLDIFSVASTGEVTFEYAQPLEFEEPYGVCMSEAENGDAYAFVNDKSGEYQQWLINRDNQIDPVLLGHFTVDTQPEGCVVDDSTQTLYLGEENRGVWVMPADSRRASEMQLIDTVDGDNLTADVEGMDIYQGADGSRWLIVSSQGDNSYAVYDLSASPTPFFVGSFRVADNNELGIDGAEETDGLAVTSTNLGEPFEMGLVVVQDGFNKHPDENQNFKLIPWLPIQKYLLEK